MTPIHFGTRRSFWLLRALGAFAFVAVGAYVLRGDPAGAKWWLGIVTVIFGGVGAVVGIVQGSRRGPRLTIDDDGVHDRMLGMGTIAWGDITGVEPYGVAGQPFIGLTLRDPTRYLARASGFKRFLARLNGGPGMPGISLNLVGLDADPMQVVELILSRGESSRHPPY